MKQVAQNLIITADDFGKSIPINEAVEEGYKAGILSAASIMVTGEAYEDALDRAHRLKNLGVGLHLTLLEDQPVLAPQLLPDLVLKNGRFPKNPFWYGANLYFSKKMQIQMEKEIVAQLEKFLKSGLKLDHVNSHKHFHIHPTIFHILRKLLPDYGNPPLRIPFEPFIFAKEFSLLTILTRRLKSLFFRIQTVKIMKALRTDCIFFNEFIFGLLDTGHMTEEKLIFFLSNLPEGTSEIYLHPATRRWEGENSVPISYKVIEERNAITSAKVKEVLRKKKLYPQSFGEVSNLSLKSN